MWRGKKRKRGKGRGMNANGEQYLKSAGWDAGVAVNG